MDPGLNEEQEMLRIAARDFLTRECPSSRVRGMEQDSAGYSPALWRKIAELAYGDADYHRELVAPGLGTKG